MKIRDNGTQKLEKYLKQIKFSLRNELEIVDVLKKYHKNNELNCKVLNRNIAWLDTGTISSLMEAGQFVQVLEKRQGLKVGCVEEQAYLRNYIDQVQLKKLAKPFNNSYGKYLMSLLDE